MLDGGGAERTLPASRYLALLARNTEMLPQDNVNRYPNRASNLWTHVLVSDQPPAAVGFSRAPDPEEEDSEEEA